jgi:hypothetical protein
MVNTLVARPVRQISHVHMRGKMTARHIESKPHKEFSALKNLTDLCRVSYQIVDRLIIREQSPRLKF